MTKKRKLVKKTSHIRQIHVLYIVCLVIAGIFLYTKVFAARNAGGSSYDVSTGCAQQKARPCYDKLTANGGSILGKNASNTFSACTSNAAPNKVGEIIQKTSFCGQEKVLYCHDGRSDNFIRKFSGECASEPPPSPEPTPEPSLTPGPVSAIPFRITYPNGGEQLPYGSLQTVRWEGGDITTTWPIYLSIVDRDRNVAIREMVINTPNDGQEEWIVDLPLGNYYVYYAQGCRNSTCASPSQWDQSDNKFSVIAGNPVEKVNSTYALNQSLVILSPSGNETWTAGSTQTIKWSGKSATSTINLSLVDNKQSYVSIARNTANDGAESWVVPAFVPPGQYKMYASCSNCEAPPSGYTGGNYTYSFYSFTLN